MFENERMTTDHNEIRKWIEEHGGMPSCTVDKVTPQENAGILRITFDGDRSSENLVPMNWNDFFSRFDQAHLAFLYEKNIPDGKRSNFYKFISCDGE